jgi:hypothetical protein
MSKSTKTIYAAGKLKNTQTPMLLFILYYIHFRQGKSPEQPIFQEFEGKHGKRAYNESISIGP